MLTYGLFFIPYSLLYLFSEGWNRRGRSSDGRKSFSSGGGEKEQPGCAHTLCTLSAHEHTPCAPERARAHTLCTLCTLCPHLVHLALTWDVVLVVFKYNLEKKQKKTKWSQTAETYGGVEKEQPGCAHTLCTLSAHLAHTSTKLSWLCAAVFCILFSSKRKRKF